MGAGTKYHSVWFSRYPDSTEGLIVHGRIAAGDYKEGYLLFVTNTFGTWNPDERASEVQVEVTARMASGGSAKKRTRVRVCNSMDTLEKLVPGIGEQIEHESAWNIPWR